MGLGGGEPTKCGCPVPDFVTSDLGPMKKAHLGNWRVIAPKQKGQHLRIAPPGRYHSQCRRLRAGHEWIEIKNGRTMSLDQVTAELVHAHAERWW
jgi:hypothetical protein